MTLFLRKHVTSLPPKSLFFGSYSSQNPDILKLFQKMLAEILCHSLISASITFNSVFKFQIKTLFPATTYNCKCFCYVYLIFQNKESIKHYMDNIISLYPANGPSAYTKPINIELYVFSLDLIVTCSIYKVHYSATKMPRII